MAIKPMKAHESASLITRETQIKSPVTLRHTTQQGHLKTSTTVNARESADKREPSYTVGGMEIGTSTRGNSMGVLSNIRHTSTVWPINSRLGTDLEKTTILQDSCSPMVRAAPGATAEVRMRPKGTGAMSGSGRRGTQTQWMPMARTS